MHQSELEAAQQYVTEHGPSPRLGIVLGSGLGQFVAQLEDSVSLDYDQIPGMPSSTVSGHAGKLWLGTIAGQPVACLQGRVHLYEGHSVDRVVFGVRLLAQLGTQSVLLTNAAGGLGSGLTPGALMLITDHLNLTGHNPLVGGALDSETRFCDMSRAYDLRLRQLADQAATALGLKLAKGVYAGVLGPSYETPAEINMLKTIGADAVGMSTVAEAIALRALGVKVGAVSLITNLAAGLSPSELSHAEVKTTAAKSQKHFTSLLHRWCRLILEG
jgi:purine-nucleoside phosphorylase